MVCRCEICPGPTTLARGRVHRCAMHATWGARAASMAMAGGASPQHPWPVRRGGKATCTCLLTVDLSFRVLVPFLGSFCHLLFFNSKKLNETKMSTGKLGMDSRTKIREFIFTPPPAMQKIVRSQK